MNKAIVVNKDVIISHTGAYWLAGQEVVVLEVDEGEYWEKPVAKVVGTNRQGKEETCWVDCCDLIYLHK